MAPRSRPEHRVRKGRAHRASDGLDRWAGARRRLQVTIPRMLRRTSALVLISILALGTDALADVRLPGLISDHMVLQRDMPARIFGQADPGEAVSVSFRGRTARTVADPIGRWEVWLDPLLPGQPADMTISGANTP
jgi:hypothetical protein